MGVAGALGLGLTLHILEVILVTGLADGLVQDAIVSLLFLNGREQVGHNTRKELEVFLQELGHIHIPDGPKADQLLWQGPARASGSCAGCPPGPGTLLKPSLWELCGWSLPRPWWGFLS